MWQCSQNQYYTGFSYLPYWGWPSIYIETLQNDFSCQNKEEDQDPAQLLSQRLLSGEKENRRICKSAVKVDMEESMKGQFSESEDSDSKIKVFKKNQKQGRNITSNIVRSFLRYLNSKLFEEDHFPILRENYELALTLLTFKKKLRGSTQRMKSYIKKKEILNLFCLNTKRKVPELQFPIILRGALRYYIHNIHIVQIFESKKILKKFKKSHLKQARDLLIMVCPNILQQETR